VRRDAGGARARSGARTAAEGGQPGRPATPARAVAAVAEESSRVADGLGLGVIVVAAIGVPAWHRASATPAASARAAAPHVRQAPAAPAAPAAIAQTAMAPVTAADQARSGTAAFERGDFGTALEALQKAVEENPEDAVSLNNLGQTLVRLGRTAEALPRFEAAVAQSPDNWSYQFNLAAPGAWPGTGLVRSRPTSRQTGSSRTTTRRCSTCRWRSRRPAVKSTRCRCSNASPR
jgi:cytochrome c-type biogenesis protein CcmH/NrfG